MAKPTPRQQYTAALQVLTEAWDHMADLREEFLQDRAEDARELKGSIRTTPSIEGPITLDGVDQLTTNLTTQSLEEDPSAEDQRTVDETIYEGTSQCTRRCFRETLKELNLIAPNNRSPYPITNLLQS